MALSESILRQVELTPISERSRVLVPRWVHGLKSWQLLFGLLNVPHFLVEEPLRSRVDDETDPLHEMYCLCWEAIFAFRERQGTKAKSLVDLLVRWAFTCELTARDELQLIRYKYRHRFTKEERYDSLFFLVTLGQQNDLLGQFELDLGELYSEAEKSALGTAVTRWGLIGLNVSSNPFGVSESLR